MPGSDSPAEPVPSLKGVVLQPAMRRLQKQIELGRITPHDLETKLEPADRELIDERIATTLWYPIASYERLVELVRAAEGGEGDAYWIRFGKENAIETLDSSAVQVFLKSARTFGSRAGVALIKLSGIFFNFGTWTFEGESLESFRIVVTNAERLSDPVRLGSLGFLMHLVGEFAGHDVRLVSERPSRSRVIFRTD